MKTSLKSLFLLATLALSALSVTTAHAESTTLRIDSWSRFYDVKGQPIGGLAGRFCTKVFFESGQVSEVCEPVVTNPSGHLTLVQSAKIWKGADRPAKYSAILEVSGVGYAGRVSASWDPNCKDKSGLASYDRYSTPFYDTTCDQVVHFVFDLPVSKACSTKMRGELIQHVCTLASNSGLPELTAPRADDQRIAFDFFDAKSVRSESISAPHTRKEAKVAL